MKVVKAEVKSVIFTSDHGVMTDWNTNYAGSGGTVYDPRGWRKYPLVSNPVSHTKGQTVSVSVIVCVEPAGVEYDLEGNGANAALDFLGTGLTSTGSDQTVVMGATQALPTKVDVINDSIVWKIKNVGVENKTCDAGTSGGHKIYVTWNSPGSGPTEKRISYVYTKATGATTLEQCADKLWDAVAGNTTFNLYGETDGWALLDGGSGDCDNQSRCMKYCVEMLGAGAANVRLVSASTDSDCLDLEQGYCDGHARWESLLLDSDPGFGCPENITLNNFEGCCEAANHYYAITPPKKAQSACDMLCALTMMTQRYAYNSTPCCEPDAEPAKPGE